MKIIVFGATGSIGRLVVEQALAAGHDVTAFTRDSSRMTGHDPKLRVVQGEVTHLDTVVDAVTGHDAVIVTLGAGRKGNVRGPGTATIIRAMERAGVRRLIVQSTIGIGDSRASLNFYWKRLMFGLLLRPAYADHIEQEQHVIGSDRDWTIVRPGAFVDGPLTGRYRHGFDHPDRSTTLKVSRADVAHFVLDQLSSDMYRLRTPALSY
jgi:putative NADH-flavin reductase